MTERNNHAPRDLVPGFAAIVRSAREALGWSQNELARKAEVSAMCVSDLEAENRSPSLRVAAQIARALGLKLALSDPGNLPKQRGVSPGATARGRGRRKPTPAEESQGVSA